MADVFEDKQDVANWLKEKASPHGWEVLTGSDDLPAHVFSICAPNELDENGLMLVGHVCISPDEIAGAHIPKDIVLSRWRAVERGMLAELENG